MMRSAGLSKRTKLPSSSIISAAPLKEMSSKSTTQAIKILDFNSLCLVGLLFLNQKHVYYY